MRIFAMIAALSVSLMAPVAAMATPPPLMHRDMHTNLFQTSIILSSFEPAGVGAVSCDIPRPRGGANVGGSMNSSGTMNTAGYRQHVDPGRTPA